MLRLDLAPEVTAKLRHAYAAMPMSVDLDTRLATLLQALSLFPVAVLRELLIFRASPAAPSAALITGLPVDVDLPPTPTNGVVNRGRIGESSMLTVATMLGEPVAYRGEKDGVLVQDVYPLPERAADPSNESSSAGLDFHTELTFSRSAPDRPMHEASPDYVLLLGLRCEPDRLADTVIADARRVCGRLSPDDLEALREPLFRLRAPFSFTRDRDGSRPWSPPVALVRGSRDEPRFSFDSACGVEALSPRAERALGAFTRACRDPQVGEVVRLQAGDLLIIDNDRCAHARSPFTARFDGHDRWLQRVYVRRSIASLPVESSTSYRVLV
jgi:L-asparagine oxygenase